MASWVLNWFSVLMASKVLFCGLGLRWLSITAVVKDVSSFELGMNILVHEARIPFV